jgi:type I restriction enzyme R subunit
MTQIREDYFTIMDFKKATELFADPDFDGDPVQVYEPKLKDPIVPRDDSREREGFKYGTGTPKRAIAVSDKRMKYVVPEAEVGKEFDPFDLICHVAFDQPPLSRKERANNVRKRDYFTQYGEQGLILTHRDLETMLADYQELMAGVSETRNLLKAELMNALNEGDYFCNE